MSPVAARLRQIRERLRLSKRSQLAERLGIPASTYNAYESENGPPKIEWLIELARMGVNTNWLLLGEGEWLRGEEDGDDRGRREEIDELLLAAMINTVEKRQKLSPKPLEPVQRARLVARLYTRVLDQAKDELSKDGGDGIDISEYGMKNGLET